MTRLFWTVILVIGITGRLQAQSNVETSLKADFVSSYIWRGQNLGHVSLQPELSVGWKGLSLAVWGNVALNGHKEQRDKPDTLVPDRRTLIWHHRLLER